MNIFRILVSLVVVSTAWAGPVINNSFIANITADADRSTLIDLFDESNSVSVLTGSESFKLISDFSDGKLQFNFTNPDSILYQSPTPATEGLFSQFPSNASQQGSCSVAGKSGTAWEYDPTSGPATSITLCSSGNTPISLVWNLGQQGNVTAVFNTFTPGVPAGSNFNPAPEPASIALGIIGAALMIRCRRSPRPCK